MIGLVRLICVVTCSDVEVARFSTQWSFVTRTVTSPFAHVDFDEACRDEACGVVPCAVLAGFAGLIGFGFVGVMPVLCWDPDVHFHRFLLVPELHFERLLWQLGTNCVFLFPCLLPGHFLIDFKP